MATDMNARIQGFLESGPYAVVGASIDREKYGNKVLRCYQQRGLEVYPINARAAEVEGLRSFPDLASVPVQLRAISVITPPKVTEQVVRDAAAAGIRYVWMQPGAESEEAIRVAEGLGLELIHSGPCALVVMGFRGEH